MGNKYIVILQDYFTKWPEAIALKSVASQDIETWMMRDIIPRYGVPNELITDQGSQFVSKSFKEFCDKLGITHRRTSPFHPMTDGMVERFNRTFLNMVRNYVDEDQLNWDEHIPSILFAYRTASHDNIKVSPAEALQTRKLKLPIDLLYPSTLNEKGQSSFDNLVIKMNEIRSNIRTNSKKDMAKRKVSYDTSKSRKIQEFYNRGDRIYWKKPSNKIGKSSKLYQKWQGPFLIERKLSDVNCQITDGNNHFTTVHVNNLKRCDNESIPIQVLKGRGRPPPRKQLIK